RGARGHRPPLECAHDPATSLPSHAGHLSIPTPGRLSTAGPWRTTRGTRGPRAPLRAPGALLLSAPGSGGRRPPGGGAVPVLGVDSRGGAERGGSAGVARAVSRFLFRAALHRRALVGAPLPLRQPDVLVLRRALPLLHAPPPPAAAGDRGRIGIF